MTIDLRILGLFRIYFGGLLLYDLLRRLPYATLLYSNSGVFPNHYALYAPQSTPLVSLYFPFSTPGEVKLAFALTALVYLLYLVGLCTRWMQVLSLVMLASLNARNLFLEDGGVVSSLILATYTLLLPVGARYSLDAVRARWSGCPDPAVDADRVPAPPREIRSLWVLLIVGQLAVIYFFNTVHKTGPTWKNGEAVHWVLWQNRINTWLDAWFRMHEPSWFSPLATWGTLVVEGSLPVLLLLPFWRKQARLLGLVLGTGLHLGIAALMVLGPFSYAMIGFWILVQQGELVDDLLGKLRMERFTCNIAYDRSHPGARRLARALFALGGSERFEVEGRKGAGFTAWRREGKEKQGVEAVALACRALPVVGGLLAGSVRRGQLKPVVERWLDEPKGSTPTPHRVATLEHRRPLGWLREGLAVAMLLAVAMQISVDNSAVPRWLRFEPPTPLKQLVLYPRLLQGWRMFSPDAPREDGILVVDAVTTDGRHIDPFTGNPPRMDGSMGGLVEQGVPLCDYLFEVHFERNERFRGELRRFLDQWHTLPGRSPRDRLVSYEVWWMEHQSPRPGSVTPTNLEKTLVLRKLAPGRGQEGAGRGGGASRKLPAIRCAMIPAEPW